METWLNIKQITEAPDVNIIRMIVVGSAKETEEIYAKINEIIGPAHNPEQSPDTEHMTLPVSEPSNPEGRSKFDEQELKALRDVRLLAENLFDRFGS